MSTTIGGVADESLTGGADADFLSGMDGADSLSGQGGDDTLLGGEGNDWLRGDAGLDSLSGGAGRDNLYDDAGGANMDGGVGDDTLNLSLSGQDQPSTRMSLSGGDGDDTIWFSAARSATAAVVAVRADAGQDQLHVSGAAHVTADLGAGDDWVFVAGDTRNLSVKLGDGSDTVRLFGMPVGVIVQDFQSGAAGDHIDLSAWNAPSRYLLDDGYLQIAYRNGDAVIQFDSNGGANNFVDAVILHDVGPGVLTSDNVGELATGVLAGTNRADHLTGGYDQVVNGLDGNDTLQGGDGHNVMWGAAGRDELGGGAGDDVLHGGGGNDNLAGGTGDDTLDGGTGRDVLDGGDGVDTVSFYGAAKGLTLDLGSSHWQQVPGATLRLTSVERIFGTDLSDLIKGGAAAETVQGRGGDDSLAGGGGDDSLTGGDGVDTLSGGDGDDRLDGNDGAATLSGGAGDDLLVMEFGATGSLVMDGGDGVDTLVVGRTGAVVDLRLTGQQSLGDGSNVRITGVENLITAWAGNHLIGDDGANRLDTGEAQNTLSGEGGDDVLTGYVYSGAIFDGGDGFDTLDESSAGPINVDLTTSRFISIEHVIGGHAADTITGSAAAELLEGGDGNDSLVGGGGSDTIDGGAGLDALDLSTLGVGLHLNLALTTAQAVGAADSLTIRSMEQVTGTAFDDVLIGSASTVALFGGAGQDLLRAGDSGTILTGDAGADTLIGGAGADTLDGGDGQDVADFSTSTGTVQVSLVRGHAAGAGGDVLQSIEGVIGSAYADRLVCGAGLNTLVGGGGDDTLTGGAGQDVFVFATGDGRDVITDFGSTDVIQLTDRAGYVSLDRVGADTVVQLGDGDSVLLRNVDAASLHAENFRFHTSPDGSDVILGTDGADSLSGLGGDDTLKGLGGADTLDGGGGNDLLNGGSGANVLIGGDGVDTVDYSSCYFAVVTLAGGWSSGYVNPALVGFNDTLSGVENILGTLGSDALYGDDEANVISGGTGADRLTGAGGVDSLNGGDDSDTLDGGDGDDSLQGGAGADWLTGGAGHDQLNGGDGLDWAVYADLGHGVFASLGTIPGGPATPDQDVIVGVEALRGSAFGDTLTGSSGDDTLQGGSGGDRLTGGAGADVFRYDSSLDSTASKVDFITDFNAAEGDVIDLSRIKANAYSLDETAFTFVSHFSGTAGEAVLTFNASTNQTTFEGDTDGDALADFVLRLHGQVTTSAGWVL